MMIDRLKKEIETLEAEREKLLSKYNNTGYIWRQLSLSDFDDILNNYKELLEYKELGTIEELDRCSFDFYG